MLLMGWEIGKDVASVLSGTLRLQKFACLERKQTGLFSPLYGTSQNKRDQVRA